MFRSFGNCVRARQHLSNRPRLEPLEDRMLPAWSAGAMVSALVPASINSLPQPRSTPPRAATPMSVTVEQNSPETVLDMGIAFGVSDLQHEDGLRLSILGNTNPGLVSADLSEAALTLTYARGRSGTANITVCATDADGVSAQQTIRVTVLPAVRVLSDMSRGLVSTTLPPVPPSLTSAWGMYGTATITVAPPTIPGPTGPIYTTSIYPFVRSQG